ncbi:MAG: chemotaxis protein CheB, partial [Thermoanaerobaculia bacterium]
MTEIPSGDATGSQQQPSDVLQEQEQAPRGFPIVSVGASAGGLEPFLDILRNLPDRAGMAFIYLLHQDKHDSALPQIISRVTHMKAVPATNGLLVEPDHVYVAAPRTVVQVAAGRLLVQDGDAGMAAAMPIDDLFRSVAEERGSRAIGVVLSGTGSDGAYGTTVIKAEGGITFAQDASAQFPQMPQAAIAAGGIDFVLSPAEMGTELVRVAQQAETVRASRLPESELSRLFAVLQTTH